MIVVETVALATMVSNDLVMPILLRLGHLHLGAQGPHRHGARDPPRRHHLRDPARLRLAFG
ncbi:MAG: hypothetical protein R3D62_09870 [Xanthobacteraceae bacterium]